MLVFGAAGQVGRELVTMAGDRAVGFDRTAADICDITQVRQAVSNYRPLCLVNAAAYTAVDKAETEKDKAFRVNKDGAHVLAKVATELGAPLIHLSTDYVFDGTKHAPYDEGDAIAPLNIYGKSKAEGECVVRERCVPHIIVRTSWVYSPHGTNFVRTMLRLGRERERLNIVDDQVGCPTSATDIAAAILALASETRVEGFTGWGTYHYRGADILTWFEFARRIFDFAATHGQKAPGLSPIGTADFPVAAARPSYSVLSVKKLQQTFGITPRPLSQSLRACLDRLFE